MSKRNTAIPDSSFIVNSVFESLQEGIFILDSECRYTYLNSRITEITGMAPKDLMGYTPWEKVPDLKRNGAEILLLKALKGEPTIRLESYIKMPNLTEGRWYQRSFIPLKEPAGRITGIVGIIGDITKRKRAESALKENLNFLQTIYNSLPVIVWSTDKDGIFTLAEGSCLSVFGLESGEIVGRSILEEYKEQSEMMKGMRISLAGETYDHELTIYGVPFHAILTPLYDESGRVSGMTGIAIDISEQTRMKELLIQNEKMLSIGSLASGMAHEINNPLAGITQTAYAMSTRLKNDPPIPSNKKAADDLGLTMEGIIAFMEARGILTMLDNIKTSCERVSNVVDNMLSFSRKSETLKSTRNIEELIDLTLELASTDYDLKKVYDFKKIKIHRDYPENPTWLSCEKTKIQQVFLNLFRNSAQAMHEDNTENPEIRIRTKVFDEQSFLTVEISDNGPGMDDDTKKRAFDPFFTTKSPGSGTGLGLSISYFIITEDHEGEMEIESQPGLGTKFIIRLPL